MRQHANPGSYRWRCHVAAPGLPSHGLQALDAWCASRPFHDVTMWPGQDGCTLVITGDAPHVESVVFEVCALLGRYTTQVQHGRMHCIGYEREVSGNQNTPSKSSGFAGVTFSKR